MPAPRHSSLIVAVCLLAAFTIVAQVAAQGPSTRYDGFNARVVEFGDQRTSQPRRFAIVGDVERPGVYESSARQVLASTLLAAAGNQALPGEYFTRYHAGLLPLPSATFGADSVSLARGDVVVVSTAPNKRRPVRANDDIHVAVIGLAAEPVVIRVRQGERSLPVLFSRLNQPSDAIAAATINGVKSTELLKNGDVIAVSSHLVDRAAFAGCEDILPIRQLEEVVEATRSTTEWFPPAPSLVAPELPPLLSPEKKTAELTLPAADVAAPANETAEPTVTAASEKLHRAAEQPRLTRTEESRTSAKRPARATAGERRAIQNAAWEAPSVTGSDSGIRTLVVLLALGTLGLGVTLLWLASERRLQNAAAPEPVVLTPPVEVEEPVSDHLDELIRGELPVEDEPVVLPSKISLHGAAVGQKRLVIHPPQALAGPHFAAAQPVASKDVVAQSSNTGGSAEAEQSRPLPSPIKSPKDAEGLLDRVLLAMQREGRR